MLFYRHKLAERSPTRHCDWLESCLQKGRPTVVRTEQTRYGDFSVSKYYDREYRKLIYFLHSNGAVLAFVEMERPRRWVAHEVTYLFVRPDYRQHGVASHLYDVILEDGILLMSGWSQNPKSRGLWMKLIKRKEYTVWAQDILDLDRICQVFFNEFGELQTDLKLYHDINKKPRKLKTDVRLFAMKAEDDDMPNLQKRTRNGKR